MNNQIVYIVAQHDWEASANLGVFSTRERAQEYVDGLERANAGSAEIQEHSIDTQTPPETTEWSIELAADGTLRHIHPRRFMTWCFYGVEPTMVYGYAGSSVSVTTFARSREEALRIANEQYEIAKNAGYLSRDSWCMVDGVLEGDE